MDGALCDIGKNYQHKRFPFCFVTETHIISFIFNLGQKVEKPWPLDILDYSGNVNHILIQPGDMLYYESSR